MLLSEYAGTRHELLQDTRTLEVLESNESIDKLLSLRRKRVTDGREGKRQTGLL